jgi:ERCC4-type nuclease
LEHADTGIELVMIERKTVDDLIASIHDGRYREQSYRLNAALSATCKILYIIEGALPKDAGRRKMVLSAMSSLFYSKGFGVMTTTGSMDTAERILNLAQKINKLPAPEKKRRSKNDEEGKGEGEEEGEEHAGAGGGGAGAGGEYVRHVKRVKQDNITPDNIGALMLSQIPNVSATIALHIMEIYKTLPALIDAIRADPACLEGLTAPNKSGKIVKLNKTALARIVEWLLPCGAKLG